MTTYLVAVHLLVEAGPEARVAMDAALHDILSVRLRHNAGLGSALIDWAVAGEDLDASITPVDLAPAYVPDETPFPDWPPRRARAEGHRHEVDRSSGVADVNGGGAPARPRIACADRAADCTACRAHDHYGQDQGADRPTVPSGLGAGRRATVSRACGAPVFRAPRRDRNILQRAPALIDRTTQSKMENAMGEPVGYPRCKHKGICHG